MGESASLLSCLLSCRLHEAYSKKMDLAWNLIQVPLWLGIATFTMTILPGTPAIQNVIPIQYLDTSLTAVAIPSIVGSIGCVTFGLFYMKYCLAKSMARGETYATYAFDNEIQVKTKKSPTFPCQYLTFIVAHYYRPNR